MRKQFIVSLLLCLNVATCFSQETFKAMFYNLLNYPLQEPAATRLGYLEYVLGTYQPDLFMVCELNNSSGANDILGSLQTINSNFAMASFELNTSDDNISDQNDLQNLLYYDSSKFILESQAIVTSIFRDFNHYTLKLNSVNQSSNPVIFHIIVCHLKASSGTNNQQLRLQMVNDLQTYLDTFNGDELVILAGDLNVYTFSEPAFQELTDNSNTIHFIDPANRVGSWHNNANYVDVFTQSTRTATGLGGSTGGFDDRFDFIMTTPNLSNNLELQFKANSYQVYGNNSNNNCYNKEINSLDCAEDSDATIADFGFEIRNALYNFSDHLPVTIELETNEALLNIEEFTINQPLLAFKTTNIANASITLKANPILTTKTITIYNTLGQLVLSSSVKNEEVIVNTSSLSNGIYYITIPSMNVEPLKFVKLN
ncbi:T9SS type A sorting domain-containing protein [Lacinutrix salivirga]